MVGYVNVYWNKLAFKKSLLCAESRGNVHLFFVVMCYIRAGPLSGLSRITARYHQILISPRPATIIHNCHMHINREPHDHLWHPYFMVNDKPIQLTLYTVHNVCS